MVVAREGQAIDSVPRDNYSYLASSHFGSQFSRMGNFNSNHYVLYDGTGNGVYVTGLKQNTLYFFAVFEYNIATSSYNYLTSTYPEESLMTEYLSISFYEKDTSWHQCENANQFTFIPDVVQSKSPKEDMDFVWTMGDGTSYTDSVVTHSYSSYGKKNVKLKVSTSWCTESIIIRDTVAPLPLVDFILTPDSPNNTPIQCLPGNRFYFRNTTINPSIGALTTDEVIINWTYGHGAPSGQYHGAKSYPEPGIYRVRLKVAATKHNPRNVYCIDSAVMFVQVLDVADIGKVYIEPRSSCLGDTIRLTYDTSDFDFWYVAGDTIRSRDTFIIASQSGIHDLTLGTHTICGNYTSSFRVLDSVSTLDLGPDTLLDKNKEEQIILTLPSSYSYWWSTGDTTQSLLFDSKNRFVGEYTLFAKIQTCGDTTLIDTIKIKVVELMGVEEVPFQVSIYPNPSYDFLNIDSEKPLSYELRDELGRVLLSSETRLIQRSIDIIALESGTYFLVLKTDDEQSIVNVIKP